ncbi:hypothetical protein VFMJ11_A0744 [Aliivibrio fischeri MJ11]|uniref:Uncharacterized protein n=1 Tax=Aliivibrio fischeri (strain MJ11) TaxID=388396 RepID=B5EUC5_ALIFM|nr:hypothetical protein [Aliivibrio fischeri]ACH63512.1 hypothetical protein VFMJ11_A0744 [Aliivibrio fischeri MJ11]
MSQVVNNVKAQFARVLEVSDWEHLLEVADYHFEEAAKLKNKDIRYSNKKLLIRNSMKRLHIGIGVELALKAAFLKQGVCINKFVGRNPPEGYENSPVHRFEGLDMTLINPNDTFTMGVLIDKYAQIMAVEVNQEFTDGLRIAMTFRNKEGHTSFPRHEFEPNNYHLIANSVKRIYREAFGKQLEFLIAMTAQEQGVFNKT